MISQKIFVVDINGQVVHPSKGAFTPSKIPTKENLEDLDEAIRNHAVNNEGKDKKFPFRDEFMKRLGHADLTDPTDDLAEYLDKLMIYEALYEDTLRDCWIHDLWRPTPCKTKVVIGS